jgi:hypothetical protein
MQQSTEERHAVSNEHRDAGDDETVNEARTGFLVMASSLMRGRGV